MTPRTTAAHRLLHYPPVRIRPRLKPHKLARNLGNKYEDPKVEILCECRSGPPATYFYHEQPLEHCSWTRLIAPRESFTIGSLHWYLWQVVCPHCQTLFWQVAPAPDDERPPAFASLGPLYTGNEPTFMGIPIKFVDNLDE